MIQLIFNLSCQRVHFRNPVNLITEKLYPDYILSRTGRKYFQYISMNPERASLKVNVISVVLNVDQLPNDFIPVLYHTRPQGNHHVLIVNRAAESVDAGRSAGEGSGVYESGRAGEADQRSAATDEKSGGGFGF